MYIRAPRSEAQFPPKSAYDWNVEGDTLFDAKQYTQALACYDRALALDPKYTDAWNNKGMALRNLGQSKEAIACYDQALALDPKYAMAWYNKGWVLRNLGQSKEAIACFDQVLAIDPKCANAWHNKGSALDDLGQSKEALACFDQALASDPKYSLVWAGKGVALGKLGQYKEALACFDQALVLDPKFKEAWHNKGVALGKLGQHKEALACFDQALALDPKDSIAWHDKGVALGKLGQYKEAIACYDQALAIDSEHEKARINKANALKKLDQKESSKPPMPAAEIRSPLTKDAGISAVSAAPALAAGMQRLSLSPLPAEKKEEPLLAVSFTIPYTDITFGKKLGQGGFGVVYQGTWRYNAVAIKQLLLSGLSAEAIDEFKAEIQIMARLHSPNLIQLYGCCVSPEYCIVMEYMPKGSLYGVLRSEESLDWPVRYRIITDIACGLAYLHADNILHRDLKSLNVLLDEHYRAKLCDFGLSKVKSETKSSTTKSGGAVGTLAWMAPELSQRRAVYTPKADIYSLGMTFWEVASRKTPFADAADPHLIPTWVAQGEREDIPKDCPKKIASLIRFCWDADPTKRPTAPEIVTYLRSDQEEFKSAAAAPASPAPSSYRANLDSGAGADASYRGNFSSRPG